MVAFKIAIIVSSLVYSHRLVIY